MYQLNPAPLELVKETDVPQKNTKPHLNSNNKTYKNRKSVKFDENEAKLTNINNLLSKLHENTEEEEEENMFNVNEKMNPEINEQTNKNLINSELQKMNTNSDNNLTNDTIIGNTVNSLYSNYQDSYKSNFNYLNNLNKKDNLNNSLSSTNYDNNQLISKLNYIIHLLEEQHNEKTNHITEELILYLFLGIFIIFVLDSFAKASKYIR
tara:strand:- start:126 stop:749 length:624 start_codon:yes stop_codon:yes gene_type:complete